MGKKQELNTFFKRNRDAMKYYKVGVKKKKKKWGKKPTIEYQTVQYMEFQNFS